MKQEFSLSWKSSKQPRKQRKYRANAPLHIQRKLMSANLTKELHKKYGKKNFPIHKGDNVKIMKGEFKKKTGKIETVDFGNQRVTIEGIFRTKKDGTKVGVYFDASNLQIKDLNLEDGKRKTALERGVSSEKKKEVKVKKLPKEEKKDDQGKEIKGDKK
jgi:large subunit ribosomal protein L24